MVQIVDKKNRNFINNCLKKIYLNPLITCQKMTQSNAFLKSQEQLESILDIELFAISLYCILKFSITEQ